MDQARLLETTEGDTLRESMGEKGVSSRRSSRGSGSYRAGSAPAVALQESLVGPTTLSPVHSTPAGAGSERVASAEGGNGLDIVSAVDHVEIYTTKSD